jgi:prevent-host-death family protein
MKRVTVGIRELKQRASKLVRMVQENRNEVQITYHGRVVARLVPAARDQPDKKAWARLDDLAEEIGLHWPKGVSAREDV